RASVSRGYSPPTLAEVHPSALVISRNLEPEQGWCYETGVRFQERHHILWLDVAAFYYPLQNAISMRSDSAGNDYFINAGSTRQWGLETQFALWLLRPRTKGLFRSLQLNNAYTFSRFTFHDYYNGSDNYSGNSV